MGGVATGAVATGAVATGAVATGAVATGAVAPGAVATGCIAGGAGVVGAVATGRGAAGPAVDDGGATGGDACTAGVAAGVATGCVALQCVVEDAFATRCMTLQGVAPGAPATGLVAGSRVEPVPAVGALGGRLAPGEGLAGVSRCTAEAPPARLGGHGLTVVGALPVTGVVVGAAFGSGRPGAAEPIAPAPAPVASSINEAATLWTFDGEADVPFGATVGTVGTDVRAIATPAEAPHSSAMVIPSDPKEFSHDRFTRIANSLDVPLES
jgi:hypothetical protein